MTNTDVSYAVRFSFWATVGTLLAAIPPLVLDPKLLSHVRFGPRTYEHPVWVLPICAATLVLTLASTTIPHTRKHLAYPLLPLTAAFLAMLPFLRPEFPHGNVVMVGTVWILVLFVWHWIHIGVDIPADHTNLSVDYLKEEVLFCRSLLLGFIAAYLSLFVTATSALHTANVSIVTTPSEIFLLQKYSDLQVSIISCLFFFGPVQESLQKLRRFMVLLRSKGSATAA